MHVMKQEKVKQRLFYRDGLCWSLVWYANTWSVMESAKGDTPSPLRTAKRFIFGIAYCVPPLYCLAYCIPFNNKNNHFERFLLHKEVKITVCCMHMYSNSWKHKFFVCSLFPRCWPHPIVKSMFKFINVEMSKKSASKASAQFLRDIWLCMPSVLCFF